MPGKPDPRRATLHEEWEVVTGRPPPPFLSVRVMEKALAYEAQCKAKGGMPATTRRALARVSAATEKGTTSGPSPMSLRSGAHLVREWNGRTYQVEVLEQGFRMDGKNWRSLSALARHITGANWSGPRFFGLTKAGQGKP